MIFRVVAVAMAAVITGTGVAVGLRWRDSSYRAPAAAPATSSPPSPPPSVIYSCSTGWTPQPFGPGYSATAEPFTPGPEPAWATSVPGGGFEYPAWQVTIDNESINNVGLTGAVIVYYMPDGTEVGSEVDSLGDEILTALQTTVVGGTTQIMPTGATSCKVLVP